MPRDIKSTALRHAVYAASKGHNLVLYTNGPRIVLVLHAHTKSAPDLLTAQIEGIVHERVVSSSGMARAVVDRYSADLRMLDKHAPEQVLDASIAYAAAAWRVACRRAGRRAA
jgi:hypothetical protein